MASKKSNKAAKRMTLSQFIELFSKFSRKSRRTKIIVGDETWRSGIRTKGGGLDRMCPINFVAYKLGKNKEKEDIGSPWSMAVRLGLCTNVATHIIKAADYEHNTKYRKGIRTRLLKAAGLK